MRPTWVRRPCRCRPFYLSVCPKLQRPCARARANIPKSSHLFLSIFAGVQLQTNETFKRKIRFFSNWLYRRGINKSMHMLASNKQQVLVCTAHESSWWVEAHPRSRSARSSSRAAKFQRSSVPPWVRRCVHQVAHSKKVAAHMIYGDLFVKLLRISLHVAPSTILRPDSCLEDPKTYMETPNMGALGQSLNATWVVPWQVDIYIWILLSSTARLITLPD